MKHKFLMIAVTIWMISLSGSVFAECSYLSKQSRTAIPNGICIGEYEFEEGETENSISITGYFGTKTIYLKGNANEYSVINEGNRYLFINQTKENLPQSKLMGAVLDNSPIYFYDSEMNLIAEKEYVGYMKYEKYFEDSFYFCFTDYSERKYNQVTSSFDGDVTTHYYRTNDGTFFVEITYEDFSKIHNNIETSKLCNGDEIYLDKENMLYLQNNKVLREPDDYVRYGTVTNKGNVLYKIQYGDNGIKAAQKISIDAINYYDIPIDTDLSNTKYFNGYLYCNIIGDEENSYQIKISDLENGIKVLYDNNYLSFTTPPMIENDRTLVPMRFLFEQMGADVDWDNATQTAIVKKQGDTISFSINDTEAKVNNTVKTMDVPARLINDKTMIPLRFLSEELGYSVQWDGETRTVTITD